MYPLCAQLNTDRARCKWLNINDATILMAYKVDI